MENICFRKGTEIKRLITNSENNTGILQYTQKSDF